MFPQPPSHPNTSSRGWLQLALLALFLSNCLALVLVAARTPGVAALLGAPQSLFATALVLHVDLAIYVWVLSIGAMVWSLYAPPTKPRLSGSLPLMAGLAILIMLISPWRQSSPVLSNYLPVLDSPLFLGGGLLFLGAFLGVGLISARGWLTLGRAYASAAALLGLLGLLVLVSLFIGVRAYLQVPHGEPLATRLELVFWGSGHLMQVYNVALLVCCCLLVCHGGALLGKGARRALLAVLVLALVLASGLALWHTPEHTAYRDGFTALMRYLSWLPLLLCSVMLIRYWRRYGIREACSLALALALAIFVLGLLVGTAIRGDTLLVPSHYHAMTGALNLAIMGAVYRLRHSLGLQLNAESVLRRQLWLYAIGLVLLVGGLAGAGFMGRVRKTADAHLASGFDFQALPMVVMGLGAAVALAGSFLFIGIVFRSLRKTGGVAGRCRPEMKLANMEAQSNGYTSPQA